MGLNITLITSSLFIMSEVKVETGEMISTNRSIRIIIIMMIKVLEIMRGVLSYIPVDGPKINCILNYKVGKNILNLYS